VHPPTAANPIRRACSLGCPCSRAPDRVWIAQLHSESGRRRSSWLGYRAANPPRTGLPYLDEVRAFAAGRPCRRCHPALTNASMPQAILESWVPQTPSRGARRRRRPICTAIHYFPYSADRIALSSSQITGRLSCIAENEDNPLV
jgi:hypothetical protein